MFSLGPLAVRWYGLMYLLAFARVLVARHAPHRSQGPARPITRAQLDDLLFGGIVGVILGGRLGYVLFYKPGYYFSHPLEIFAIWQGGMSFHGGFLGVLAAMAFVAHRQRVNWWDLMDFVAPLVPIGLAAGRLGNFINGELWGRVTDVVLGHGVPRRRAAAAPSVAALPDGAGRRRAVRAAVVVLRRARGRAAQVSALFLIGYGAFRFIGEFAREPDAFLGFLAFGLTMGQWLSPADDRRRICSSGADPCGAGS